MTEDRKLWLDNMLDIVELPLSCMSKLEFNKFILQKSPIESADRDPNMGYLECFARTFAGISPWIALEKINDESEFKKQQMILEYVKQCFENTIPYFDETFNLFSVEQSIVECSYICYGFIISKNKIWDMLNEKIQNNLICLFRKVRLNIKEYHIGCNWYLFHGIIEAFFKLIHNDYNLEFLEEMISTVNNWYCGDGFYFDGDRKFKIDYYNSYVIQPFFIEILKIFYSNTKNDIVNDSINDAISRCTKHSEFLERIIGHDGSYPPLGRSVIYRFASFHLVSYCIYNETISERHSYGQLRNALTKVLTKISSKDIFNKDGFLALGFNAQQESISDYYSNSGSCYLTVLGFLPLGLNEDHIFWTDSYRYFTQEACWKYKQDFVKYKI
jgi:hypothetical protein